MGTGGKVAGGIQFANQDFKLADPGLSRWTGSEKGQGEVMGEGRVRVLQPCCRSHGGTGLEPTSAGSPRKLEKAGNSSPLEPAEGTQPRHLDFNPVQPVLDF